MKKVITWLVVLGVVAGVAAGGFFYLKRNPPQSGQAAGAGYQTARIEKGSLSAVVGATGAVHSNQSAVLTWQTSGGVAEVRVATGDAVKVGQVLAVLNSQTLPQNVILAQADLISSQQTLDDLKNTQLSLAQAEQNLANARKAVDDAQTRLDSLHQAASIPDIQAAQATLTLAKIALDHARDQYTPYQNKSADNPVAAMLLNKLSEAQKKYDSAVSKLNNLQGTASETNLSIAQANLTVTQAQLADAQKKYDDLKTGPKAGDIASAQARVNAAQATLAQAQITAPFDGFVTDSHVMTGDQVRAGQNAFQVDDLSRLLVDLQVSEVDIAKVMSGQPVSLTFDALPGKNYTGKVLQVGRQGVASAGVVNFSVTVQITDADSAILPGMTAAANVTVSNLTDVLLVPNRAVRTLNKQRVVYILRSGAAKPVPVVLGASSDTMSQVISGEVQAGDEIVLNPSSQAQPALSGGRPAGLGGGGSTNPVVPGN